ncbi:helix-turn-helix transcriptional regulator [Rothia uropygioeca]|uniref:helix-turn-helix transcriptional regulator n=1 Tax=Kocuria sp. 257 TaxID=2021970 RepID=UPI001EDDBA8C|nr:helix-turn-helix domain-containing protein [Kocuria sp. 257]
MTDVLAERHSRIEADERPALDPGAQWLTMQDLADRYQVALQTIRVWHSQGKTPRSLKLNNKFVRFRLDDVQAWEREQIGEK